MNVNFVRNGASKAPSPTVCMSITLFSVGADSISALLAFQEHMECSPTVFESKILFACSRIVTVLIAHCCRGRRSHCGSVTLGEKQHTVLFF